MTDAPVRIALVGAGLIGRRHAEMVAGHAGARLAAIVDPAPHAVALAQELGAAHHASLESLAAERLASKIAPEVLIDLEELHDAMLTFYKIGNHDAYFDTNSDIHDFIIAHAGNPALAETHARLIARARRGRFLAIMKPDRLNEAVQEHETLMTALRNGDAEAAARVWRTHLLHTGATVARVLEETGLPT